MAVSHVNPPELDRRTITRGAAWAVPIVAVAAAAPAFAASRGVVITFSGTGCKFPGRSQAGKEYGYRLVVDVTSDVATTVSFQSVVAPNYPDAAIIDVGPDRVNSTTVSVPAGSSQVYVVIAADLQVSNGNSANGTATFTYITGTGDSGVVTGDITGFKPCKS